MSILRQRARIPRGLTWRLAVRDLTRHPRRTTLAFAMVFLPVLLLGLAATAVASMSYQPYVPVRDTKVMALAEVEPTTSTPPGEAPTDLSVAQIAQELQSLTGRSPYLTKIYENTYRTQTVSMKLLGVSAFGAEVTQDGLIVTSGRLPVSPDEVLVTQQAKRRGFGAGNTIEYSRNGQFRTATVVGTGHYLKREGNVDVVHGIAPDTTWSELLKPTTNTPHDEWYGAPTWHFAGTVDQLQPVHAMFSSSTSQPVAGLHLASYTSFNQEQTAVTSFTVDHKMFVRNRHSLSLWVFLPLMMALLLGALVIGVLVAPAFTSTVAEHRQTLELFTQNGANPRQVQHIMLIQGVLVGGAAALANTVVFTIFAMFNLGAVLTRSWPFAINTTIVPAYSLAAMLSFAVIGTVASALACTRATSTSAAVQYAPAKIWPMLVGVGFFAAGMLTWSLGLIDAVNAVVPLRALLTTGVLLAVVGLLFMIPAPLRTGAALASVLPPMLRLAARDAHRERRRTAPIVASAAIAMSLFMLGVVWFVPHEKEAEDWKWYTASSTAPLPNHTVVEGLRKTITDVAPQVLIHSHSGPPPFQRERTSPHPFAVVVNKNCVVDSAATTVDLTKCTVMNSPDFDQYQLKVVELADFKEYYGLPTDALTALADGGVVDVSYPHHKAPHQLLVGTGVLTSTNQINAASNMAIHQVTVHGLNLNGTPTAQKRGTGPFKHYDKTYFMTAETAQRLGVPTPYQQLTFAVPPQVSARTVIQHTQRHSDVPFVLEALQDHRKDAITPATVQWMLTVVLGIFLLVVVALNSTLNQRALAHNAVTLHALGASARTTSWFVAAQSWWVTTVGLVAGVVYGVLLLVAVPTIAGKRVSSVGEQLSLVPVSACCVLLLTVPLACALCALAAHRIPHRRRRT